MEFGILRTLRTLTSERFLLRAPTRDSAVLDVHYLADGSVTGTLLLLEDSLVEPSAVENLIEFIDQNLFPNVSLDARTLSFTVVRGDVVGQFENDK